MGCQGGRIGSEPGSGHAAGGGWAPGPGRSSQAGPDLRLSMSPQLFPPGQRRQVPWEEGSEVKGHGRGRRGQGRGREKCWQARPEAQRDAEPTSQTQFWAPGAPASRSFQSLQWGAGTQGQ